MEILIGIFFLIFMLFIDHRLNKIYKELQTLNQVAARLIVIVPTANPPPQK